VVLFVFCLEVSGGSGEWALRTNSSVQVSHELDGLLAMRFVLAYIRGAIAHSLASIRFSEKLNKLKSGITQSQKGDS
jgi:hypothetical protein